MSQCVLVLFERCPNEVEQPLVSFVTYRKYVVLFCICPAWESGDAHLVVRAIAFWLKVACSIDAVGSKVRTMSSRSWHCRSLYHEFKLADLDTLRDEGIMKMRNDKLGGYHDFRVACGRWSDDDHICLKKNHPK